MSSATAEGNMTQSGVQSGWFTGLWRGRWKYLAGAIMITLSVVMLLPIYATVTASLKLPAEAAGIPPTYFPQSFTFESYAKLWDYQHGLPRYLFNSFATAFLSIIFTVVLTVPAGFALARFFLRVFMFICAMRACDCQQTMRRMFNIKIFKLKAVPIGFITGVLP